MKLKKSFEILLQLLELEKLIVVFHVLIVV